MLQLCDTALGIGSIELGMGLGSCGAGRGSKTLTTPKEITRDVMYLLSHDNSL